MIWTKTKICSFHFDFQLKIYHFSSSVLSFIKLMSSINAKSNKLRFYYHDWPIFAHKCSFAFMDLILSTHPTSVACQPFQAFYRLATVEEHLTAPHWCMEGNGRETKQMKKIARVLLQQTVQLWKRRITTRYAELFVSTLEIFECMEKRISTLSSWVEFQSLKVWLIKFYWMEKNFLNVKFLDIFNYINACQHLKTIQDWWWRRWRQVLRAFCL